MARWPAELPQDLNSSGVQISLPTGSVRADTESGPAFQRQRFTAAPEPFSGNIWVDAEQYQTFRAFYVTALAHGALPFDWKHPITEAPARVQFDVSNPPRVTARSGELFQIDMNIEVLP